MPNHKNLLFSGVFRREVLTIVNILAEPAIERSPSDPYDCGSTALVPINPVENMTNVTLLEFLDGGQHTVVIAEKRRRHRLPAAS